MFNKHLVQFVELSAYNGGSPWALPYATSGLRAYAESFADIRTAFDFAPTIFMRDRFESLVERVGAPDLLALSCYVWNFNASMALAAEVKGRSPSTIVVIGGAHPKYGDDSVLAAYPAVDAIVQGEGESAFRDILRCIAADGRLSAVDGLTYRDPVDGRIRVSPHRAKAGDLSVLPSPYAAGLMDLPLRELRANGHRVATTLESNRGCPFQCTFCDWGSLGSKLAEFSLDRVFGDIEWVADNQIESIWLADSNFGMRKRDKEISSYLAETYRRTGYPKRINVATSKNSSRAVLDAIRPLAQTPMFRGHTLSFQSLSEPALRNIKRQNIKHSAYIELLEHARSHGEKAYTEMILGLPGETLESFKASLAAAVDMNFDGTLNIYRCVLLPNAELASSADRARFGIRTAWMPVIDASLGDARFTETYEFVAGTDSMPERDAAEAAEYGWLTLLLHSLRLATPTLLMLRHVLGFDFATIFDTMLGFLRRRPDRALGSELLVVRNNLAQFLECSEPSSLPAGRAVPWYADPNVAARSSRSKLAVVHDQVAAELTMLTAAVAKTLDRPIDDDVRGDLYVMLQNTIYRPLAAGERLLEFKTDLPDVLMAAAAGRAMPITHRPTRYRMTCPKGVSVDAFRTLITDHSENFVGLEPFALSPVADRLAS